MKVFLTGASGFLGSHITELLLNSGHDVKALKRRTSEIKMLPFYQSIEWYDIEDEWIDKIIIFSPEIIIHAAWNGVDAPSRNNWERQLSNISFVYSLLEIAKISQTKRFISLGSQAEYGPFSGKIDESCHVNPTDAYGAVKTMTQQLVQSFCEKYHIDWVWLRVFSVFGERESENWLIASTIIELLNKIESLDFTLGEQKYAYLYVGDFAQAVLRVVEAEGQKYGIYNISSNKAIKLKEIILMIKDILSSKTRLNFGAIPYRVNQPMHIEGDINKFFLTFGTIQISDLRHKLEQVVLYYKNRINEAI